MHHHNILSLINLIVIFSSLKLAANAPQYFSRCRTLKNAPFLVFRMHYDRSCPIFGTRGDVIPGYSIMKCIPLHTGGAVDSPIKTTGETWQTARAPVVRWISTNWR